jgi:hypothetical protein
LRKCSVENYAKISIAIASFVNMVFVKHDAIQRLKEYAKKLVH